MHTIATCRTASRPVRVLPGLLLLTLALLAGCGHGHHYDEGRIVVDNRTDLTTNEYLLAFRVAAFGRPFTGDLLGGDLAPGSVRSVGWWHEDYYDAEADLELGGLVEWFDLFVGDGDTTVFEAQ